MCVYTLLFFVLLVQCAVKFYKIISLQNRASSADVVTVSVVTAGLPHPSGSNFLTIRYESYHVKSVFMSFADTVQLCISR